jgi:uncharacterized membrane protein
MQIVTLYLSTALIFLILDAVMLTFVMRPLFTRHLGDQLLDGLRVGPALVFYLGYIAGMVYLVSLPALRDGAALVVPALVLGAMAYGTYEFTSYAVMRSWHWSMVLIDTTWGATLTALAAWGGVMVARQIG